MRKHAYSLALLALSIAATARALAGLPLPSLTFYGMFLDHYGWPYSTDDVVEVYANGVRVASKNLLPATGKDYNFLLRLPYDSGGVLGDYSAEVISPGDDVQVRLIDTSAGQVVVSTNFICRLPAGSVVNFNSWSGTDSLGDGLPDELRRWIWAVLGNGAEYNPSNIRASDDSDGDGVSNLAEYRAGTDPANAEDVLKVVITAGQDGAPTQLSFFSVPGKTYQVQTGLLSATGVTWNAAWFANSPESTANLLTAIGTGHGLSVFVPTTEEAQLYRVVVMPQTRGIRLLP